VDDDLSTNLQALYQALWGPLEQTLGGQVQRVIVSPDGDLNFISFATLLTNDNQFLSEKYRIHYVASGRDLLRPVERSATRNAILFTNPDFNVNRAPPALVGGDRIDASGSHSLRESEKRDIEDWIFGTLEGTQSEGDELMRQFARWDWKCNDFSGRA
jgi:CHAT domain-containing protein